MATPSSFAPNVLLQLRRCIAERLGLAPQDWVLEARVSERMRALGVSEAENYVQRLTTHKEQTALVELLRVGETRFYRHESQMRGVLELVLPALRRTEGVVKVWSAGCATGEEAYTLAMLLSRGLEGERPLHVLASDISPSSLATAREGVYREAALAALPASYRTGLERADGGRLRVSDALRSIVEFEERNLANGSYPEPFDLIFCRNVLIYFEESAKEAALKRLVNALAPGAFLFLGYAESLRDVPGLEVVSAGNCTAYRRTSDSRNTQPPPPGRSTRRTEASAAPDSTLLSLRGEYASGERLALEMERALESATLRLVVDLDGADYLAQETADVLRDGQRNGLSRGVTVRICATREGHLRFLRRHGLWRDGDGL